jgi:hypothetical protein
MKGDLRVRNDRFSERTRDVQEMIGSSGDRETGSDSL